MAHCREELKVPLPGLQKASGLRAQIQGFTLAPHCCSPGLWLSSDPQRGYFPFSELEKLLSIWLLAETHFLCLLTDSH